MGRNHHLTFYLICRFVRHSGSWERIPLRFCSYQGSERSHPCPPPHTHETWLASQQDLARTPMCSSSPHGLGLTWGLLGLHLLLALLQHRLALGGGKHPCGRYSPSFPLPCLLCPYSAHLKQEIIKARTLSICLLHNLQLLISALTSEGWNLNVRPSLNTLASRMSLCTWDQNYQYTCERSHVVSCPQVASSEHGRIFKCADTTKAKFRLL